ncbi:hypothetical protein ACFU8W_18935 [Streptomyces sp. NPDC057565]|uniref:hypothetical protein n=1 Tax=Streptomyces sp. NPDC057565 TaxID=3346169 RepID=UPI003685A4F5
MVGGKDKVVLRTAEGSYTTVLTAPMGGRAPILASGDFTEDGTADLAVGHGTNTPFTQGFGVVGWRPICAQARPTSTGSRRFA